MKTLTEVLMYVESRERGECVVEVHLPDRWFLVTVDDLEPYDPADNEDREDHNTVWGPILDRALDEAIYEFNRTLPGESRLAEHRQTGWRDEGEFIPGSLRVFEVAVEKREEAHV